MAWNCDDSLLIFGNFFKKDFKIFNLDKNCCIDFSDFNISECLCLSWNPFNKNILAVGDYHDKKEVVKIFDIKNKRKLKDIINWPGVFIHRIDWLKNGLYAIGYEYKTYSWKVFEVKTGKVIFEFYGNEPFAGSHTFMFAKIADDGNILINDLKEKTSRKFNCSNSIEIVGLAWSVCNPNNILAVGYAVNCKDGNVIVYDIEKNNELNCISINSNSYRYNYDYKKIFIPRDLEWCPWNSSLLAIGYKNGMVMIWNYKTGDEYIINKPCKYSTYSIKWSKNGKYLAVGFENGHVIIWNIINE